MAPLDMQHWLGEVSADAPAGPNLEFDADFGALERAAQGKAEQQSGDTLIAAEPPDWKEVAGLAAALLERTRDLRVAGHLAVAQLNLRGLPGYAEGLAIVLSLLQTRWAEVHPQLDPEDDNDPTLRANALLQLVEPGRVLKTLRDLPLANSVRAGKISWRDIALATGAVEPEDGHARPSEGVMRGAFQDTDQARLVALREALESAVRDLTAIPVAFEAQAGPRTGPDFTATRKLLLEIQRGVDRFAPAPGETAEAAADEAPAAAGAEAAAGTRAAAPAAARGGGGAVSVAMLTSVESRADAIRLLDLVCRYYERNEPSSPLPLLIERARRLADKNFLDILRDLAPDGLSQAKSVAGTRDE